LTARIRVETERASEDRRVPPWVRNEHLARYRFAASFARGQEVIDCASGDGTCSRLLAEAGARRILGFDLSPEAVSDSTASNRFDQVSFAVADATSLPVPADSADLFVSLETIEHLADDRGFLREVARVLRPAGTFLCSTPDRDVYSPGHDLGSRPWNKFHVREYSQAEFVDLLGDHFGDVTLYGQNKKSVNTTALLTKLGRRVPADLVVRAKQVCKLPRALYDTVDHHLVVPAQSTLRYEYLVAVCSAPRGAGAATTR
jgi:ubiquinone/menaquinone biosynthesis C-methylase UbiE